MFSQWRRTLSIFRLALSYWGDYRAIQKAERILSKNDAQRRVDQIYQEGGVRFRHEALRLQGLIIKVGQFLSSRTDILPLTFTKELQQLQDQVPAAPFVAVKDLIETEFLRPLNSIFAEFSTEPVAAASLGQVHEARLVGGFQRVAVKVQRPHIRELATTDLRALARIMSVLKRWTKVGRRLDTVRLFEEFRDSIYRELDYVHEQENLERFKKNFQKWSLVKVPDVYSEYTKTTILVMEFLEGIKLTDMDGLAKYELEPKALAAVLVETYLKQIVLDGFVQIDPHPGNFLAGMNGQLIYLDFGMMASIPVDHVDVFGRLVEFGLSHNTQGVVDSMIALGFVRPSANLEVLARAVGFMLDRITGVPLQEGAALTGLVHDFQDFLYEEPLQFPAQYMFLGRAIGMVFGLVAALDPDLDWMALLKDKALPMVNERRVLWNNRYYQAFRQQVEQLFGPAGKLVWDKVAERFKTWGQIGLRMPQEMDQALNKVAHGSVSTRPEITPALRRLDRISVQLSLLVSLGFGGFSVLMAFLWASHHGAYWLRDTLYIVGAVSMVFAAFRGLELRRINRRIHRHE